MLDVYEIPLDGVQLIEASAGTGKTHTIGTLYLRLLLETGRDVEQILVVTFTKAATAELRERIRARLASLLATTRGDIEDSDGEEGDGLARWLAVQGDRQRLEAQLLRALRDFDQAAIFTIHGFCQRVLGDAAFEGGVAFETELLADQSELVQEVVDDIWRREMYAAPASFLRYLRDTKHSPESLCEFVRRYTGNPFLRIEAPRPVDDYDALSVAYHDAYATARGIWNQAREEIHGLLTSSKSLSKTMYKAESVARLRVAMDGLMVSGSPPVTLFDRFERFTASGLVDGTNKGGVPPRHVFFDACERLAEACEKFLDANARRAAELQAASLTEAREALARRKRRDRLRSYDDLLKNLHDALDGERGQVLRTAIRHQYTAALVDEFQDTDPLQYAIFERLYGDGQLSWFMVGDPKQAIYSFRGADVFAYLSASDAVRQTHTLDRNWRSESDLIHAVNTLFGRHVNPFLISKIGFEPTAAAEEEREPLTQAGEAGAPFRLWFVGRGGDGKPISKERASSAVVRATAAEIVCLLNGDVRIGERKLSAGDVAVLVRTHKQAEHVQEVLGAAGVANVQQGQRSIFASHETLEVERVLAALVDPADPGVLRAALLTDMLGMSGDELARLGDNDEAWESVLVEFHQYRRLWHERGFARMLRAVMRQRDVTTRLLRYDDGERRLTNTLHLAELLQAAEPRCGGPSGLVNWISRHRTGAMSGGDEQQLRLESDDDRVKIATVHAAKGLEYAIVFCPFIWDGGGGPTPTQPFTFHDPEHDYQACLELGSENRNRHYQHARHEALAEELRLLYVALTRAKYRCYAAWGAVNKCNGAAPAWLLHPPDNGGSDAGVDALERWVKALSDDQIRADLDELASASDGAIQVEELPQAQPQSYRSDSQREVKLNALPFNRSVDPGPGLTSFSALAVGRSAALTEYEVETDAIGWQPVAPEHGTIFSFPRGVRTGNCLHRILELMDFGLHDRAALEALVARELTQHGFDAEWTGVIADAMERVVKTPLDGDAALRLNDIQRTQRVSELAFHYPVTRLDVAAVETVLGALDREAGARQWTFANVRGFMAGFVDLVFERNGRYYIVDYKSHWLGSFADDYRCDTLTELMRREGYDLQYLIYTVAVHRLLRLRLQSYDYDSHFGGVFYLFLRGMDPQLGGDNGVFRARPERALVERFDRYLETGVLQ